MDAHHRHYPLGLCCPCSSHGKPVGSPAVPRCFPLSQTCAHTSSQHTRDGARALWRLCRGRSCRGSSRFSCLWTRKGSWKIQSSPLPSSVCWQAEGLSRGSGTGRVCPLLGPSPRTLGSEAGCAKALGIGGVSYIPRGADKKSVEVRGQ